MRPEVAGIAGKEPVRIRLEQVAGGALPDLGPLLAASLAEELNFVKRLCDDWAEGRNRFDGPGEVLFVALADNRVVGVCGLTRDPFVDATGVGRVRRLFVLPELRGQGIGGKLLEAVIGHARGGFRRLHVRTPESGSADRFYLRHGFLALPVAESEAGQATHVRDLA